MTPLLTKVIINICILLLITIGSTFLLIKIKFEHKGYRFLFIVYMFFWIAPMLLRSYAGTMQGIIDKNYTWIVLASYGFVGIFIRVFADWLNFTFKSRKAFLYFACVIQIAFFIPLICVPNTITSIIQSIGVGIGASCIGSFQLLFKEQYNKEKSYLSVSLLSIPPLIADFLTAPIQSIFMSISKTNTLNDQHILKYMWLVGIVFTSIAFIMLFFLKEDRNRFDTLKSKQIFNKKTDTFPLIVILIIGLLITFIKFSISGSVATLNIQSIGRLENFDITGYEGYLSTIFSSFQLIGGILMGLVLIKKMKPIYIFSIGSFVWIIHLICATFMKNPYGYFAIHSLAGFGYGILYNLILGQILTKRFNNNVLTPMGIYQSVLAIGISLSGIFTQVIKNNLIKDYWLANTIVCLSLIGAVLLLLSSYIFNYFFSIKIKQKLNGNKIVIK